MVRCGPVTVFLVLAGPGLAFTVGSEVLAKTDSTGSQPRAVALFPTVGIKAPVSEIIERLEQELAIAVRAANLRVLRGRDLAARLRQTPQVVASRCGEELACWAKVGRRLQVSDVVMASAAHQAEGVLVVTLLAVEVESVRVQGRVVLELNSANQVTELIPAVTLDLLGLANQAAVEQESSAVPGEETRELPLVAVPEVSTPLETAQPSMPVEPPAGRIQPVTAIELGETAERPALIAVPDGPGRPPSPRQEMGQALTMIGALVGFAGGALVGTGIGFGYRAQQLLQRADQDHVGQIRAKRLYRQGNTAVERANILFIAGSSVVLIAAVLLGLGNSLDDIPAAPLAPVSTADSGISPSLKVARCCE